jgi:hypothetical protein
VGYWRTSHYAPRKDSWREGCALAPAIDQSGVISNEGCQPRAYDGQPVRLAARNIGTIAFRSGPRLNNRLFVRWLDRVQGNESGGLDVRASTQRALSVHSLHGAGYGSSGRPDGERFQTAALRAENTSPTGRHSFGHCAALPKVHRAIGCQGGNTASTRHRTRYQPSPGPCTETAGGCRNASM